jgi:lipopolysaccharide/colanic/teichoic acid biosynthesis glycosyltransferase
VQRLLDIALSGFALLALSFLLLLVMMILRLTGEGEVFFVQQRVGRCGLPFGLYKFATMLKDSPNLGTGTVTVKGDPASCHSVDSCAKAKSTSYRSCLTSSRAT